MAGLSQYVSDLCSVLVGRNYNQNDYTEDKTTLKIKENNKIKYYFKALALSPHNVNPRYVVTHAITEQAVKSLEDIEIEKIQFYFIISPNDKVYNDNPELKDYYIFLNLLQRKK